MTHDRAGRDIRLRGSDDLVLAATEWGADEDPAVLLLHGGGQTRHSWKSAGSVLAGHHLHVYSLDLRGHGDSDWARDAAYGLDRHRDDVLALLGQIGTPVVLVGASLGGLTSLLVTAAAPDAVSGLVLVDITTRVNRAGGQRIRSFMEGAPHGFTSLEEASAAIAAYLPHREKPRTLDGLRKNLRRHPDGRWYWHWDPALFATPPDPAAARAELDDAARGVRCPAMLLHGTLSDVVDEDGVAHLETLIPHVRLVSLSGAAHTAAADDNDAFTAAVVAFVTELYPAG